MTKVKTFSNLNTAVCNARMVVPYRAWLILRSKDSGGQGWHYKRDAIKLLAQETGKSVKHFQDTIRKYDGVWWDAFGDKIRMFGFERMIHHFELETEGDEIDFDIEEIATLSHKKLCANFGYSFMAKDSYRFVDEKLHPKGTKTISRAKIQEEIGITPQTQRKWEEAIGVKKQFTHAWVEDTPENAAKIPIRDGEFSKRRDRWVFDINHDGVKEIVWQMPNRYTVKMDYVRHSRRIRSRDSSCPPNCNHSDHLSSGNTRIANRHARIFYDNPKAAYKAITHNYASPAGVYLTAGRWGAVVTLQYTPSRDENK